MVSGSVWLSFGPAVARTAFARQATMIVQSWTERGTQPRMPAVNAVQCPQMTMRAIQAAAILSSGVIR